MNVQGIKLNNYYSNNKNKIQFKANINQITSFLEKADLPEQHKLGLQVIIDQFVLLQKNFFKNNKTVDELRYNLCKKNYVVGDSANSNADRFLKEMDDSCSEGIMEYTKGRYLRDCLQEYGFENPDEIVMTRPEKKHFSLFDIFKKSA